MADRSTKNVGGAQRRTWDLDEFEQKARERIALGDKAFGEGDVDDRPVRDREEFKRAVEDASCPSGSARAFLNSRAQSLGLEKAAGKTQVITDNGLRQKGGGWYCDVCECLLKDTANYLDHINGKKHQRKLGFSMRVERSSLNQVQERFALAKKRKEEEALGPKKGASAVETYELRIAAAREEEEQRKRARREQKNAQKKETQALVMEGMDPEIMEAMGFSGFGGSNKV